MKAPNRIVDAWIQHPTGALIRHPMFAPLRRWDSQAEIGVDNPPIEHTLEAMDEAGVTLGCCLPGGDPLARSSLMTRWLLLSGDTRDVLSASLQWTCGLPWKR